jgi:hypothetical protein
MSDKKLLILFKLANINDQYHLVNSYMSKYKSVDYYFINCDINIENDIKIDNRLITFKMIENNWESLLIKVIKAFQIFKNEQYTNIMVSNVSTFINIPNIIKKINIRTPCLAHLGYNYKYKNTIYDWPSGAGYIFNMDIINKICKFFNENNFITIDNKFSQTFINNYPTTDDIFFGYYFKMNNIPMEFLDRCNIININYIIDDIDYSHYRIKTGNCNKDYEYMEKLIKKYIL